MANYVLVVLGLLVSGLNGCKENVCLKKEIMNRTLILDCKVYELGLSIEFHHPKGVVFGDCPAPIRDKNSKLAIRCDNNITQNLNTNITTLTIKDIDKYNVSGEWICTHGSYPDAITIPVYELHNVQSINDDSCKTQTSAGLIGFFIFTTLVSFVFNAFLLWKRKQQTQGGSEREPLLADTTDNELKEINKRKPGETKEIHECCETCHTPTICVICVQCEKLYCGICYPLHLKCFPEHNICRIEHFFTSKVVVYCKICLKEIATCLCKECKRVLCNLCGNTHECKIDELKDLNPEIKRCRSKTSQCSKEEIDRIASYDIPTEVRICGIAFLLDCRIVVGDYYNYTLMVFKGNALQQTTSLTFEPRGIAQVNKNEIAVTNADQYQIHIYEIDDSGNALVTKVITFRELNLHKLKPFSICCNKNRILVEAGEGEDGCIVLLDNKGELLKIIHIENPSLVHFSGHTIRMALDISSGHIFISSMSRKTVSCIDLGGKELWTIPLTDPRGIVVIQEETMSKKNIIVASKACNIIFRLNKNTRSDDVLLAKGDVIQPRYIAYHAGKSLLCIHVTTKSLEQQLLLYRYYDIVDVSYNNEQEKEKTTRTSRI